MGLNSTDFSFLLILKKNATSLFAKTIFGLVL